MRKKIQLLTTRVLAAAAAGALIASSLTAGPASAASTFTQTDLVRTTNAFLNSYYINGGDFKTSGSDSSAIHFWEASSSGRP